jgi:hypothetical protein
MDDAFRRQICALIEGEIREPGVSRSRRFVERIKSLIDSADHTAGVISMVPATLALPLLVPAYAAARVVELTRKGRARAKARRRLRAADRLVELLRRVRAERQGPEAGFRQSAVPPSLLAAPPPVAFLFQQAEGALLVRFTIASSVPWKPGRTLNGFAVLGIRGERALPVLVAWSESAYRELGFAMERVRAAMRECLPCAQAVEYWSWTRGAPGALNVLRAG